MNALHRRPAALKSEFGLLPLVVVLFLVFFFSESDYALTFLTITLILFNLWSSRHSLKRHIVFFIFNLTFFFFLVSRKVIKYFWPRIDDLVPRPNFSAEVSSQTELILFISFLATSIAYYIFTPKGPSEKVKAKSTAYCKLIRKYSRDAFFITSCFYIIVIVEKFLFSSVNTYESYYTHFESNLPGLIVRIGLLCFPLFFVFIGTLPSRREEFFPLVIYLLLGSGPILWGQRNGLVKSVIFLVIYFCLRDVKFPKSKKRLNKKTFLVGLLSIIPILVFLTNFTYYRSNVSALLEEEIEKSILFVSSQGSAIHNLSHIIALEDTFPEKFYSLGPLTDFARENPVSRAVFDIPIYRYGSSELAMSSHNMSFILAYLVSPRYYSSGGGFGSNYIGELWLDFGIIGLIIGSSFLGFLMAKFMSWVNSAHPFLVGFIFAGTLNLLYSPRASFLSIFTPMFSAYLLIALLLIHFLALHQVDNGRF